MYQLAAPANTIKIIFCLCKTGRGAVCGFWKSGLKKVMLTSLFVVAMTEIIIHQLDTEYILLTKLKYFLFNYYCII